MIWKDTEFSINHQVSSTGLIRNKKSGRILKPWLANGYPTIRFKLGGKNYLVHRLVALSFIPKEKDKNIINHINGIITDNRVENLEWCDKSYNFYHAISIGLCDGKPNIGHKNSQGSKHGSSKLTEENVKEIRELRNKGLTLIEIGDKFNISFQTVSQIVNKQRWKHVN